ncbi:MAG: UDP-N-acetylmuramate--L-alanine ligase [Defluviitaleaceae bacterium]|nr:UDP-N-acetylmuramate--L-alanine ligase [Defluviitaleaceae bacterium]
MDRFTLQGKKIHFIGIGGAHMSGLAEMCRLWGLSVSGSDAVTSDATAKLMSSGVRIQIGHSADNIDDNTDLVVYTSAVKPGNPEFERAKELSNSGAVLMDKAGLVGLIMENYEKCICIAGSHGKTTTTAMIGETIWGLGMNPTVVNGGVCTRLGTSMLLGGDKYFVVEADEYYDAFLKMHPTVGVILNIEHDHTDYFPTEMSIYESFRKFAENINPDGALIVNKDVNHLEYLTDGLKCRVITFGEDGADFNAGNVKNLNLSVPGKHNVMNALAAVAACFALNIDIEDIVCELTKFTGAGRRFQLRGELNGAKIYDDYAHNPTEIRATLSAAKSLNPSRLIAVLQPHTRSRTLEFFDDFAACMDNADEIVLLDIFTPAGREEGHINISSEDLCKAFTDRGINAVYRGLVDGKFTAANEYLRQIIKPGDMVIIMGAGDNTKVLA